jgi:hypothetical protein
MRLILVAFVGVLGLLLAAPAGAATVGTADFYYDDDGDLADGVDSGGADGVDTSGIWATMGLEILNQASDGSNDQIKVDLSAYDPDPGSGSVGYDITSIAFMFDAAQVGLVTSLLTDIVNSTTEGLTSLNWEIVFPDGGSGGDGLPNPTNDVGDAAMGALIVDLALGETCGDGVIKTCGETFGAGEMDSLILQFLDGSLEGLMLADIFDFAYIRLQSVSPDSIGGDGSLFLGAPVQEIPLPPTAILFGTGILFLVGFIGLRRRHPTVR